MNVSTKSKEVDIFDIIIFVWSKKYILIASTIIGFIFGYFMHSNTPVIYENKQMVYFNDYQIQPFEKKLDIQILNDYFLLANRRSSQVNFLMKEFNLNDDAARSVSSSFIVEEDKVKNYVRILHVGASKEYRDKMISKLYADYIGYQINHNLKNIIANEIASIELEYNNKENDILSKIDKENIDSDHNIKKDIYQRNLLLANELELQSPSEMLHIVDGNHGIFSYGTDSELKDELLSYEDRIFLFGSIVLKSKLDDLEEQKEKFALQGRIVLDEIVRNKELEIFNTKSFYNNLGLDINDISLVKVNEFDNSNNVRVSSKLYPYIGILIGLFIGLSYVVISSGIRRKIEENHF